LNPYWLLADPWVFETAAERHAAHRIIDGVQNGVSANLLYGFERFILQNIRAKSLKSL
jgi:hypothetical protein